MKLVLEDESWMRLAAASADERGWLEAYVSCVEQKRVNTLDPETRRRRLVAVEEVFSMLSPSGLLPLGLLPVIRRASTRDGVSIEVLDQRTLPGLAPDPAPDLRWLYDYQAGCVQRVVRANRGLVKVPTGGGKTEVFIGLTRAVPAEWLFVTHRADLVSQAAERFRRRTGERAGTYTGRDGWKPGSSNVTVSTFQALARAIRTRDTRALDLLLRVTGVAVDEVHAQPADTFYNVTMLAKRARWRVGLSGTPLDRSERASLRTIGAIGPVVAEVPTQLLIDRGVLAKPTIRMVVCAQPALRGQWHEVYQNLIVHSEMRNDVICQMVQAAEKPALVFVEEVDHGRHLVSELERRGLRVGMAHGTDPVPVRQRKLESLVRNTFDAIVCTVVFQEGVDVPDLRSVVVASGKSSTVAALQRIGRGMRASKGKTTFEVWDVDDRGHPWLSDHAVERAEAYQREGHSVEILWPREVSARPEGNPSAPAQDP